jgi:thiosulfate/3-mercaptopyruvate sulfurtransferase
MPASDACPLISVADLAGALAAATAPVLLDVRWRLGGPPGIDDYRAGHLPGAVYADLDTQLAGPPGDGGRHPLPDASVFEAAMRAAGVRNGGAVVVYDEADATAAARAWWLLGFHGHSDVRVLDGGLRAWVGAGLPLSTTDAAPVPGDFTARPGQLPVLDARGAAEIARSGILLDARAPARYRGETEPVDRVAGHIPGALSSPSAENVTADGTFRPPAELRARFASLGVAGPQNGQGGAAEQQPAEQQPAEQAAGGHAPAAEHPRVGAYCGSGVVAAHEVLTLALIGIPAALYVGSWSGWIADPARPVATGPRPGDPPG